MATQKKAVGKSEFEDSVDSDYNNIMESAEKQVSEQNPKEFEENHENELIATK